MVPVSQHNVSLDVSFGCAIVVLLIASHAHIVSLILAQRETSQIAETRKYSRNL
jgi:hypothetical protein